LQIRTTLRRITEESERHARFLNSLSYLEYRGFRKIARSRQTEQINLEILLHTSEEIRHALFFKRRAVELGGLRFDHFSPECLLAERALKNYFYQIDAQTVKLISSSPKLHEAAYYLITWLVEVRALQIYHEYELLLKAGNFGFSLSGILKEESHHLKQLGEQAQWILKDQGFSPETFRDIEEAEFQRLWSEIESEVMALQ
jgi:hypothetical protein